MFVENLESESRAIIFQNYLAETHAALSQVIGKTEQEAAVAVHELWSRFEHAPKREQNFLLNTDPVALACDLVGEKWSELDKGRLDVFNKQRHASRHSQAQQEFTV